MSANFKNYSVLQVLPHLDSGGLVSGAIEISKALTEKKLGSYIASSGGSRSHEVVRNGAKIFNIPVKIIFGNALKTDTHIIHTKTKTIDLYKFHLHD